MGPFESIEQMCRDADLGGLNRKTLESLIQAGAFDDFGERGAVLNVADRIVSLAQSESQLRDSNQSTMFDLFGESVPTPLADIELTGDPATGAQLEEWETDLLGVALSESEWQKVLAQHTDPESVTSRRQIVAEMDGDSLTLSGQVSSSMERRTREGKPYVIATLRLQGGGEIDVFVWEDVRTKTWDLWEDGRLVRVSGRVRVRGDRISITCAGASEINPAEPEGRIDEPEDDRIEAAPEPVMSDAAASPVGQGRNGGAYAPDSTGPAPATVRRLSVRLHETGALEADLQLLEDIRNLMLENQGEDEVKWEVATKGAIVQMDWPIIRVSAAALEPSLREIVGAAGRVSVLDEPGA